MDTKNLPQRDIHLNCIIAIENQVGNGTCQKKTSLGNASVYLGRNEFRDLILKIENKSRKLSFALKDIILHKNFLREGKATISFPEQKLNIFISNCPPNTLLHFLKTLYFKYKSQINEKQLSQRDKLLSERKRTFEQISPLQPKDIQTQAKDAALKSPETKRKKLAPIDQNVQTTPKVIKKRPMAPRAPFQLTEEQRHVLSAVLAGKSVFFTGSAGTGKSFLLRQVIAALPPDSTAITAATGIAACHISGVTLHSFAGIGTKDVTLEQAVLRAKQRSQLQRCRHLVIDEISMVHGHYFNTLERVARAVRNSDKPFGGIQLIVCGDFLQLPPVSRKGDLPATFCFQTAAWRKSIEYNFELTRVMRQKDSRFVNLLQKIRYGKCGADVQTALRQTSGHLLDQSGIVATRICTHNDDVDFVNMSQLAKLPGNVQKFSAVDTDPSLSNLLGSLCPSQLELKVGAQVMLTKNLDLSRGLANGSRGIITAFDTTRGLPKVKFVNGVEETVDTERWVINRPGGSSAMRRQLPLKLAWSVSVHKSQGMSLDCVEVSLSRVFESGQAYVALSRATALEGLRVVDFDPQRIQADPRVLQFYSAIRYAS